MVETKVDILSRQPLVSIITPTYNHERYIEQCIESVLAQTYPNWEQIIIDDGSTDKTQEKVLKYKDERVHYIRQENVGIWRLGEIYNKALEISRGEFIAILEGDDYWPPYKLERQLPAFANPEVVLSWGMVVIVNDKGKSLTITPKNLRGYRSHTRRETLKVLLLNKTPFRSPTVAYRKDALLSIGGFQQPGYAPLVDQPTYLELCLVGEFSGVDEILGYWRRHEGQATRAVQMSMAEADSKYSIDFFKRMSGELRDSIGISINDLETMQQQRKIRASFVSGRLNLIDDRWDDARKNFGLAITEGSLLTKLKSLLGLFFSYLRVDLESAAKVLHRPRWK